MTDLSDPSLVPVRSQYAPIESRDFDENDLKRLNNRNNTTAGKSWTKCAIWILVCLMLGAAGFLVYYFFFFASNSSPSAPPLPPAMWGTYRPQHYVGLTARSQSAPIFGLMWFDPDQSDSVSHIRHKCDSADLTRFGWRMHDGRSFAEQELNDTVADVILKTEWILEQFDGGMCVPFRFSFAFNPIQSTSCQSNPIILFSPILSSPLLSISVVSNPIQFVFHFLYPIQYNATQERSGCFESQADQHLTATATTTAAEKEEEEEGRGDGKERERTYLCCGILLLRMKTSCWP